MTIAIRLTALLTLATALAALASPAAAQEDDTIPLVGVTTAPPGDPRTDLSTSAETCARLDEDETLEIAVFTGPVPETRGISGFEFSLAFDPDLLQVTASDPMRLLAEADGSNVLSVGEEMADDGDILVGVADFGQPTGVEPDGTSETGPGLLLGLTLTNGSETGVSELALDGVIITDDANGVIPVDSTAKAEVAVNTDCPGTTSPTPGPTPEPTQQADDGSGSEALAIAVAVVVLAAITTVGVTYRLRSRSARR